MAECIPLRATPQIVAGNEATHWAILKSWATVCLPIDSFANLTSPAANRWNAAGLVSLYILFVIIRKSAKGANFSCGTLGTLDLATLLFMLNSRVELYYFSFGTQAIFSFFFVTLWDKSILSASSLARSSASLAAASNALS